MKLASIKNATTTATIFPTWLRINSMSLNATQRNATFMDINPIQIKSDTNYVYRYEFSEYAIFATMA